MQGRGVLTAELKAAAAANFAEQPHVAAAFLFGSQARGTARPNSDVDVAVLMEHGHSDDVFLPVTFATDLMRILRRDDVDVVIANSAPPVLMHRVARDGEILFTTSNTVVAEFVIHAVQQFEDMRPLRELQDRQTRQRLGMAPLERP